MNPTIFGIKPVGVTWTRNIISTNNAEDYYDICWNGTAYLIVGSIGATGLIYTAATPGGTWTSRTFPIAISCFYACATDGSRFVTIGSTSSTPSVYSNNNGATWIASGIANRAWRGLCYGGSQFVAVSDSASAGGANGAATSSDGITWTSRTIQDEAWEDVFYGGSLYVAVGKSGAISTSPDGITWTARTSGTTDTLRRVRYKSGVWCAVGGPGGGGGTARVLTSFDGTTWTNQSMPVTAENFEGLAAHKNFFIASPNLKTTYNVNIWRSISGISGGWSAANPSVSASLIDSNCPMFAIMSDGTNIITTFNNGNPGSNQGVLISS